MTMLLGIFVTCVLFLGSITRSNGAEILCLMGNNFAGHELWSNAILQELTDKAHDLTIVSMEAASTYDSGANIKHVQLDNDKRHEHHYQLDEHYSMYTPLNAFMNMFVWYESQLRSCQQMLESSNLQQTFKQLKSKKYDLIIYDASYGMANCLIKLVQIWPKAPLVALSKFRNVPELFELAGTGDIGVAQMPYFGSTLPVNMNFFQRMYNLALYAADNIIRTYVAETVIEHLVGRYFPIESLALANNNAAIQQRLKLILTNTHAALEYAQPLPANIIELGVAAHMEQQAAFSESANMFNTINKSYRGVIVISFEPKFSMIYMGQKNIQSIYQIITEFSDYYFIWRTKKQYLPKQQLENLYAHHNLPPNYALLANSRVKAILTNCDVLSMQEAAYFAVPVLALPMIHDQPNNAQRLVDRNVAIYLNFRELSKSTISTALAEILSNKKYQESAKRLQNSLRANLLAPEAKANWYIEQLLNDSHVFDYLSAAPQANYFIKHHWDVATILLIFLAGMTLNVVFLVKQMKQMFKKSKTQKEKSERSEKSKNPDKHSENNDESKSKKSKKSSKHIESNDEAKSKKSKLKKN